MNKFKKQNRNKSKRKRNEIVANVNARNNRITATVNMAGKGTNNQLHIKFEPPIILKTSPVAPAPVAPIAKVPEQKPKRKITPWGWAAIILGIVGVAGGAYAGYHHYKKSA